MSEWPINHYHDEVLTDSRFHTPLAIYGISKSINWKKSSENANVSVYFYKKEHNLYFFYFLKIYKLMIIFGTSNRNQVDFGGLSFVFGMKILGTLVRIPG